jgi:hypothetical protein
VRWAKRVGGDWSKRALVSMTTSRRAFTANICWWTIAGRLSIPRISTTRCLSLNEEANLNVLNKSLVAVHTRVFEEDKSYSREITLQDWRERPWGEKIRGRIGSLLATQM